MESPCLMNLAIISKEIVSRYFKKCILVLLWHMQKK